MVDVRCVAINEFNLHPQEFLDKFIQECKLEGNILAVRSNRLFAAAMVRR